VQGHGFVALAAVTTDEAATEVFKKIDVNGGGVLLLDEWCTFLKAAEIEAGTPTGILLAADEEEPPPSPEETPKEEVKPTASDSKAGDAKAGDAKAAASLKAPVEAGAQPGPADAAGAQPVATASATAAASDGAAPATTSPAGAPTGPETADPKGGLGGSGGMGGSLGGMGSMEDPPPDAPPPLDLTSFPKILAALDSSTWSVKMAAAEALGKGTSYAGRVHSHSPALVVVLRMKTTVWKEKNANVLKGCFAAVTAVAEQSTPTSGFDRAAAAVSTQQERERDEAGSNKRCFCLPCAMQAAPSQVSLHNNPHIQPIAHLLVQTMIAASVDKLGDKKLAPAVKAMLSALAQGVNPSFVASLACVSGHEHIYSKEKPR